jgi:hypothetical protein
MKALAARPRDAQDIKHLTEVLNLHTVAEVLRTSSRKRSRRPGSAFAANLRASHDIHPRAPS